MQVQTVRSGLPCLIRVMNRSGDDILTTYDCGSSATCVEAEETLEEFWDRCIEEFQHEPTMFGRLSGQSDFGLIETKKPNLTDFDEILVQPTPLIGG